MSRRDFRLPRQLANDPGLLAGVAHDLRQPLALLSAQFALKSDDDPGRIAITELQFLIDELIDFKAAEVSDAATPAASFALDDVLRTATIASRPMTTGAPFRVSFKPSQLLVHAPRSWVYRIVVNLVSNAIKHSRGDQVELWAEHDGEGLSVYVKDNGRGMPPDLVQRLYEQVGREVPAIRTRGLGVRTALLLTRALGGRLHCISNKNGTEWRIRLDVAAVGAPQAAGDGMQPLSGRLVVVLDDNRPIAEAAAQCFTRLGADTLVFTDDFDLLTATQHLPRDPDLYVLDFMLSDSFCGDCLSRLKRRSEKQKIVILTAHPNHPELRELIPPVPVLSKPLTHEHCMQLARWIDGQPFEA
jgi:CheY-like chemotaxis protein